MDNQKKRKKSSVPSPTCLECEKLKKELAEVKGKYLRVLADYQNFEKRVKEEKNKIFDNAKKDFILKLLPFLDNLEKAEIFNKDKGLMMIKDNFWQILKSEGLEEIDVLGKEFDPYLAEAVEVVYGEKDNQVVEVVRKGYRLNNNVIRIALVKVSKQKIEKETKKVKEELLKGDYM